jgi:hypothetical protein
MVSTRLFGQCQLFEVFIGLLGTKAEKAVPATPKSTTLLFASIEHFIRAPGSYRWRPNSYFFVLSADGADYPT